MNKWMTRFGVGPRPSSADTADTADEPAPSATNRRPAGLSETRTTRFAQAAVLVAPLAALSILAAWLRLYGLGAHSLWLDETITGTTAMLASPSQALDYAAFWPDRAPLNFMMTWLLRFLGTDDSAVRLPYAVAGILAALAMYSLGSKLYGRAAGWTAGILMAILPFSIHYSQEAGPAVLVMLFTIPLMAAAHDAAHRNRIRDWTLLATWAALDLYSSYLAVPVVGVAFGYAGLVRLAGLGAAARTRNATTVATELEGLAPAIVSTAALGVVLLPWVGHFGAFLGRPDAGFARIDASAPLTIDGVLPLLAALDLSGLVLALFMAGLVTATVDLGRGQWRRSALPLLWLVLPIAFYYIRVRGGIVTILPHYFVEEYAVALLLAAIGVSGIMRAFRWAWRRASGLLAGAKAQPGGSARLMELSSVAVGLGLVAAVVAYTLPVDATIYTASNGSDYRGAVDRILAADPEHPVVLAVGQDAQWNVEIGLRYYAWARHSSLEVIDGGKLDNHAISVLQAATSVWGAAKSAPDLPASDPPGPSRETYQDTVLVPPDTTANLDRAKAILNWAAAAQPALASGAKLIELAQGHATLGPELLPGPATSSAEMGPLQLDRWTLQAHASVSADGRSFVLEPAGGEINAIYVTSSLQPGADYLLSFQCDNSALSGHLNVYVTLQTSDGVAAIFPDGAGYVCAGDPSDSTGESASSGGVIAFSVTPGATSAMIWARATGTGVGRYSEFSLRQFR